MAKQSHNHPILEALEGLKEHTPIEIEWLDASESDVQDIDVTALPNGAVETRIREIGWYIGVQKGAKWRESHLLFYFRMMDGRYRISSIPLPLVKRVVPLEAKIARKYGLIAPDKPAPRSFRRTVTRFQGGVKYLRQPRWSDE